MGENLYVFEETQYETELHRLRTIEEVFDPVTKKCLSATGLSSGWQCLEVGAGAGSIATWLGQTVGSTGRLLAIDINARFLTTTSEANTEVIEADIRTASVAPESFDLAHAQFVFIHIVDWAAALAATIRCLKPGGWLVLEEPDFSASRSFAGRPDLRHAFENVHYAIQAMFAQRGMDYAFGAKLPAFLQECGLDEISMENDAIAVPGGSPFAKMMGLSTNQLRDEYIATGLATQEDIELYNAFTADPTCWATYHATVRVMRHKRRDLAMDDSRYP